MPDEPNHEMDQLLRRYAKERRQGPDPALHPATRRMLQGEVARVHQKPASDARAMILGWLRRFWPYLAATAVLAVIVIDLARPERRPPGDMAAARPDAAEPRRELSSIPENPPPPPAPKPVPARSEKSLAFQYEESSPMPSAEQPAEQSPIVTVAPEFRRFQSSLPAPAPSGLDEVPAQDRALTERLGSRAAFAPPSSPMERGATDGKTASAPEVASLAEPGDSGNLRTPAAREAASAPAAEIARSAATVNGARSRAVEAGITLSRADQLANLGAARRTRFIQATNQPGQALPGLLPAFHVEALGDRIRFVDADGSIYEGRTLRQGEEINFPEVSQISVGRQFSASDPDTPGAAPLRWPTEGLMITNATVSHFEVQGTNLSLGLPVLVRGQLVEKSARTTPRGIAGVAADTQGEPLELRSDSARLPRTRAAIVGTAQLGATNIQPFRALAPE